MGYMRHHTIIVCSWDQNKLQEVHTEAVTVFGEQVSNIVGPFINNYAAFFVAPDGSKEGWETSDLGDKRRDSFTEWLNDQAFGDCSNSLGWVEVQFEDDGLESKIVRDSDDLFRQRSQENER